MRERLAAVKSLRHEFGNDVPAEQLEAVGFVRQEQEEGVVSFLAVERLAQLAVQETQPKDHITLPETRLELEIPTGAKIEAKVSRRVLNEKMMRLKFLLNPADNMFYHIRDEAIRTMLGEQNPFFEINQRVNSCNTTFIDEGYYPLIEVPNGLDPVFTLGESCFEIAFHKIARQQDLGDNFFEAPAMLDDSALLSGEFLTGAESEILMTRLQILRSIVSDSEELYGRYDKDLSNIYSIETWEVLDSDKASPAELQRGAMMRLGLLGVILSQDGFPEAGQKLNEAQSFSDARNVIVQALQNNEFKRAYKQFVKEWQLRRKQTTDPEEIRSLSAERAQQKDALKASQKTLLGIETYLNLPKYYSRQCLAAIKDLEEMLIVKSQDGFLGLELDTAPDPEIDVNAGDISGDCTSGESLHFSDQTGLRNVKVRKLGKHVGNIYVLQTTEMESNRKVWHFDAIQIPDRAVDWDKFPQIFIETFSKLAAQNDVQILTINSEQHHISNYDYISKSFMRYFGTEAGWKEHGQMELLANPSTICDDPTRLTRIDVERYKNYARKAKFIQAMADKQVILWQADK